MSLANSIDFGINNPPTIKHRKPTAILRGKNDAAVAAIQIGISTDGFGSFTGK